MNKELKQALGPVSNKRRVYDAKFNGNRKRLFKKCCVEAEPKSQPC